MVHKLQLKCLTFTGQALQTTHNFGVGGGGDGGDRNRSKLATPFRAIWGATPPSYGRRHVHWLCRSQTIHKTKKLHQRHRH